MPNKQLWAPWRIGYIVGDKSRPPTAVPSHAVLAWRPGASRDCFLCQDAADPSVAGERQNLVICRSALAVGVLNRYPYNNGHTLVAPQRHVARLQDLTAAEHLDVMQMIARLCDVCERQMKPEGFNVGINLGRVAGAGVPGHLHWHIVPRWHGDVNFMPVLADTSVLPQSLDALYDLLHTALHEDETSPFPPNDK